MTRRGSYDPTDLSPEQRAALERQGFEPEVPEYRTAADTTPSTDTVTRSMLFIRSPIDGQP